MPKAIKTPPATWSERRVTNAFPILPAPSSLHLADLAHGVVGALAVLVPELRKLRRREIARLEADIDERVDELLAGPDLVDGRGQRRDDRGRRPLRGEQTDPEIIGHVVAELLHGGHIGQGFGALGPEGRERAHLAGFD